MLRIRRGAPVAAEHYASATVDSRGDLKRNLRDGFRMFHETQIVGGGFLKGPSDLDCYRDLVDSRIDQSWAESAQSSLHPSVPFLVKWHGRTSPPVCVSARMTSIRLAGSTTNKAKPPPPAPDNFPARAPAFFATSKTLSI